MYKKKLLLFLMTLFIFRFTFSFPAEENENLRMNFIKMVFSVTSFEDLAEINLLYYIPIITNDSIPILLNLTDNSNYNLNVEGFSFKTIKDDKNLIRLTLKNCVKNVKNSIAIDLYTLEKTSDYSDMPRAVSFGSYVNLSKELTYFTQPSPIIQSDASEIKTRAYEFIYRSWNVGNVIEILNQIIDYTGNTIEFKVPTDHDQTALGTLEKGYAVCTGKANLAAALCRALGIPARILLVLPSHFTVEVWIPEYGWVCGESTGGIFPFPKKNYTVAWEADIDDENYAGTDGIIDYCGLEDNVHAFWLVELDDIFQPENWIEEFVVIEGNTSLNNILFKKGGELWRIFCQLKNSGLSNEQLSIFSEYQQLYFHSLVDKDIQTALDFADFAISEAKRLLNL